MSLTHGYFQANGYSMMETMREAFFDYAIQDVFKIIPYLALFIVFMFFIGYYLSKLLLRPFEDIEKCLDQSVYHKDKEIYPKSIFGLGPLTGFSQYFFRFIYDTRFNRLNGQAPLIPEKYNRVDQPLFDTSYFVFCMIFTVIFAGINSILLYLITTDIHANMIQLAIKTLNQQNTFNEFIQSQTSIIDSCLWISFFLLIVLYGVFIYTRFLRVTGPAFAFFRSMKHFMSGSKERVFLRSYDPVHRQADKLNQFFDMFEAERSKK